MCLYLHQRRSKVIKSLARNAERGVSVIRPAPQAARMHANTISALTRVVLYYFTGLKDYQCANSRTAQISRHALLWTKEHKLFWSVCKALNPKQSCKVVFDW